MLQVELPQDIHQVPDVFVYLYHGADGEEQDICYARFPAAALVANGFSQPAQWVKVRAIAAPGQCHC